MFSNAVTCKSPYKREVLVNALCFLSKQCVMFGTKTKPVIVDNSSRLLGNMCLTLLRFARPGSDENHLGRPLFVFLVTLLYKKDFWCFIGKLSVCSK